MELPERHASPLIRFDFSELVAPLQLEDPVEVVTAYRLDEVAPALRRVQEAVDRGLYAAGFVSYEAAPAFDAAMAVPPAGALPLVWFGLFAGPSEIDAAAWTASTAAFGEWRSETDERRYRRDVESIRDAIGRGDFYQVNYTVRLRAAFEGSPIAAYHRFVAAQRAPFSAYFDIGGHQIISMSPELFFRVEPSSGAAPGGAGQSQGSGVPRRIVTRPMKGTHRRGRWSGEDSAFRECLRSSPKERAENLMIVDLLRNDLGRIARTGSVRVDELFAVERYPTLFQMTSTISADLRDDVGLPEILAALFPCGSVTGAPKIAAMRRIAVLEPQARGVYCGAIGVLEPGGREVFSVAIRTVVADKETGVSEYGVGSGITWDSSADAEAEENRLKSAVLAVPVARPDLFQTLRLEDWVYTRAGRHVDRILESAEYFDIPARSDMLRAALEREAARRPSGTWRVRLRLSREGEASAESEPLAGAVGTGSPPAGPSQGHGPVAESEREPALTFALALEPIDRNNRLLFHKVADRTLYLALHADRPDVYDVLMWNLEGELTEFTRGNLVVELDAALLTPPLGCGLLPGVLRAELLEAGTIRERVLRTDDLRGASRVWLINSLRGWVPMRTAKSP